LFKPSGEEPTIGGLFGLVTAFRKIQL